MRSVGIVQTQKLHQLVEAQKNVNLKCLSYLLRKLPGHELHRCDAKFVSGKLDDRVLLIRMPVTNRIDRRNDLDDETRDLDDADPLVLGSWKSVITKHQS